MKRVLLAMSLMIAGCGASTIAVGPMVTGAGSTGAEPAVMRTAVVHVEAFTRRAGGKDGCDVGIGKTGMFNERARIVTEQPVDVIVTQGMRTRLTEAGASVVAKDAAAYVIRGSVEEFRAEEYVTGISPEHASARVRFDVIVRNRAGKVVWAGTGDATATSPPTWNDATEFDGETLRVALASALDKVVGDGSFWKAITQAPDAADAPSAPVAPAS